MLSADYSEPPREVRPPSQQANVGRKSKAKVNSSPFFGLIFRSARFLGRFLGQKQKENPMALEFTERVSFTGTPSIKVYEVFLADLPVYVVPVQAGDEIQALRKGREMFASSLTHALKRGFF